MPISIFIYLYLYNKKIYFKELAYVIVGMGKLDICTTSGQVENFQARC